MLFKDKKWASNLSIVQGEEASIILAGNNQHQEKKINKRWDFGITTFLYF